MDRSDIVDSHEPVTKGSRNWQRGVSEDDAMVFGGGSACAALTVLQQVLSTGADQQILGPITKFWAPLRNSKKIFKDSSSQNNVIGRELQCFIISRLNGNQYLAYKLRLLNKSGKERVEQRIKEARINILNIKDLAKSQLSSRIQNLDVFVKEPLGLKNLPTLSPVHFPSTQNINLIITGAELEVFTIKIQTPLILQNIYVINESNLAKLYIHGKYEVVIQDCTFSGLQIGCFKNAQVSVVNTRFMNMVQSGFKSVECDSLFMEQITIKDCGYFGCYVRYCENVSIDNIQVVSCGLHGICFEKVNNFKLRNAFVQDCGWSGIVVFRESIGEIQSSRVQGCEMHGISVWDKSILRYAQIQCDNNAQGEFNVHDDCQFLRMN